MTAHSRPQSYLIHESLRLARRDDALDQQVAAIFGLDQASVSQMAPAPRLKPLSGHESRNALRPRYLSDVVGQGSLKPLLRRLIDHARSQTRPLHHMLFVGAAGTGKTTLASVIANEIGTRTFALEAPLDMSVLSELREVAHDRDVIFVDEIHKQVSGDRRGLTEACDPENFYMLLEDGLLASPTGPLSFPKVTWIGATTDVGLMPQPLSDRFTIQPRLAPYSGEELVEIARRNATALHLVVEPNVCTLAAGASRGVPRLVNNYIRAASDLSMDRVTDATMREVITVLNSTTLDGLTDSMQTVLKHLLLHGRRETREGTIYIASVNNLATACGHGRDTKAINLLVEPYLIQRGLVQVTPRGRMLTPAGVERARQLLGGQ